MILGAFPDMEIEVDLLLAEDDLVVGRWTATATHQGPMMGIPPSGRPITITGIDIQRVADGKIVEVWHQEDILGMLQQIGALPEPPPAT
jgi:predicted ester cyclase